MNKKNIHFHDFHSGHCDFAQSILKSLGTKPATIAPKFFYDSQGAQLFDAITELPEYYQTRTEMAILSANVDQIASQVGTGSVLIEPGGGNCAKIHILLDGLKPDVYIPMDIAKEHLRQSSQELALAFGWLEIHATCIDYSDEMRLPPFDSSFDKKGHRVVFFPGSTIGNFTPQESIDFLSSIAQMIGPDGYLLIGVDLKKDKAMLEAAYDDAAGITARFNLNLLTRINRELGGNFDLDAWQHKALYDQAKGRIEMHLISRCNQTVSIGQTQLNFVQGEGIHTENSYKYTTDEFIALAAKADFQPKGLWVDEQQLFSVHLFRVKPVNSQSSPCI